MRTYLIASVFLVSSACAFPKERKPVVPPPTEFEIGRHTSFDFGPPTDFYELFLVRPRESGASIERITLTPSVDECFVPAKTEAVSTSIRQSVADLLENHNPCAIPEKDLRRQLKRCKKCLVFSYANVSMRVQCGPETRIIRADVFDRDWFDPAANTPDQTSWTIRLLGRLDKASGPGVMDQPIFPTAIVDKPGAPAESGNLESLAAGAYDSLFRGAPDRPSDLYRVSKIPLVTPTVRLVGSTPFQPENFVAPVYPPIARLAHAEHVMKFAITVGADGSPTDLVFENSFALFQGAVSEAAAKWKFPKEAIGQRILVEVEFKTNCPPKR